MKLKRIKNCYIISGQYHILFAIKNAEQRREAIISVLISKKLLMAASFRFIATAPISEGPVPDSEFHFFFEFFFYPPSIFGPWITFSSFKKAKGGEYWITNIGFFDFLLKATKWVLATVLLEISDNFIYTNSMTLDFMMMKQCQYWWAVALLFVACWKHTFYLYFNYALNYAIMGLDGISFNAPKPSWLRSVIIVDEKKTILDFV